MKIRTVFDTWGEYTRVAVEVMHDADPGDKYIIGVSANDSDFVWLSVRGAKELRADLLEAIKQVTA